MTRSIFPIFIFLAAFLLPNLSFSQLNNDECFGATRLDNSANFCSTAGAFVNAGAEQSTEPKPDCWPDDGYVDVWYSFVAQGNSVTISISGNTNPVAGGTILRPEIALYSGNCQAGLTEVECSSDNVGDNYAEMFVFGLIPGGIYYIRASARQGSIGTFQLCLNSFNEVPEPSGDCVTGVLLCDKSSFSVDFLIGGGNNVNELAGSNCDCGGAEETASTWYKWTCKDSGTLGFTLTPNNPNDDLDFIVYELPDGVNNCSTKRELVCIASGENVGRPFSEWAPCTGATGLSLTDTDLLEECGCQTGNNNFVQAINMVAGRSYALVVNNFSASSNGFNITWTGTGTFLGPEPDFIIDPPIGAKCDEPVVISDNSVIGTSTISNYFWSFGEGANPATSTDQNPGTIIYNSFGTKYVSLTIESAAGCVVTKVFEFEIEECCRLLPDLVINLEEAIDPVCADTETGLIEVSASGGNPFYNFSRDGGIYTPSTIFGALPEGDYELVAQDIKGCRDTIDVSLFDPPALTVDAGEDVTVTLGCTSDLEAVGSPAGSITTYVWSPAESLTCDTCTNPTAIAPGTSTYTVVVSNDVGCTASDEVTVFVNEERPIYIPNVISANNDGINDYFTLYGGKASKEIEVMRIYDRWGALMFEARNIELGDERQGWDGTFNGDDVNPGVYAFYAQVVFIDNVVLLYEGSITVLK